MKRENGAKLCKIMITRVGGGGMRIERGGRREEGERETCCWPSCAADSLRVSSALSELSLARSTAKMFCGLD